MLRLDGWKSLLAYSLLRSCCLISSRNALSPPPNNGYKGDYFIILLFAEGSPLSGFYLVYVVSQDEVSTGCVLCILPHQCLDRNSPKTPVLSNVCNYRFGLVTFLSHQFGYKRWQTDTIWKHHAATMLFVPGGETWMSSLKSQCVWLFNFFVCFFAFLFCWFSCL